MTAKAVQVSIDVDLLRRVDAQPETHKRGRSAFVRLAIESYLRAKERREFDEAISTAYGGHADTMLAEVEGLLDVQTEVSRRECARSPSAGTFGQPDSD